MHSKKKGKEKKRKANGRKKMRSRKVRGVMDPGIPADGFRICD